MKLTQVMASFDATEKEFKSHITNKRHGLAQMQWEHLGRLRHELKRQHDNGNKNAGRMLPKVDDRIAKLQPLARKIVV